MAPAGDRITYGQLRQRTDFIDALLDRGRSWHTGYCTEDFVNALNFKDIKKESQIKILKQLDRTVIENYLKETEKSE